MKSDVFNVFWDRLQFNTVRAAFNLAIAEHDNELISEIEKKIAIEGQEMMDKKKELKKEKIMEMWDSWETYYGGRTTALTEIINLIKEK